MVLSKDIKNKEKSLNFNFLSNNVNGLQSSKKRRKLFEYFKSKIGPKGIIFLQEVHSTVNSEKKWSDEFSSKIFFSHGKSNSCGVLISFNGNINFTVKQKLNDQEGRILLLDTDIDGSNYLLINLYKANTEKEQLKTLTTLSKLLQNIENVQEKNIILAGDFNVFFDKKLESQGGNPALKKFSVAKILNLTESLNLCDIWRSRNLKKRLFTFRQRHFSGIIQRRLDYIFTSNHI